MSIHNANIIYPHNIVTSMCETFPVPNKKYKIETGIIDKFNQYNLPINSSSDFTSGREAYVEFVIAPLEKCFLNVNKFFLELNKN